MHIGGTFLDREANGGEIDAVLFHPPAKHTPYPRALTLSSCANGILLQTPATLHLRDLSPATHGADRKCRRVHALGSSLETMADETRKTNIPVSLSPTLKCGTTLKCVPRHLPDAPAGLSFSCPGNSLIHAPSLQGMPGTLSH